MTADSGHGTDTGGMDMKEHLKTWNGFLQLIKWIVIGNAVLFLFLFIFRTHN
jgi:hypothetical protein